MSSARVVIPAVASIIVLFISYFIVAKDEVDNWDEIQKYEEDGEQW